MADGARWPGLFVAVNLSPLQIRDAGFVDLVGAVMAETGIAASRVVLEVTEGVLIDDPQQAQARLEAFRALGVRIALDDFGTGYSSLSYLQRFPFDRVKIDRAFVASLGTSGNAGAIIQSIVTLGHALGMKVLGEGVETDEQRVLLPGNRWHCADNYLKRLTKTLSRASGGALFLAVFPAAIFSAFPAFPV
jgi:EAL domain-containing protein (putative c-di-GMP-specific phosphodiesterase class I)